MTYHTSVSQAKSLQQKNKCHQHFWDYVKAIKAYPGLHHIERMMLIYICSEFDNKTSFIGQSYYHSTEQWAKELGISLTTAKLYARKLHEKKLWIRHLPTKKAQMAGDAPSYTITKILFDAYYLGKSQKGAAFNAATKALNAATKAAVNPHVLELDPLDLNTIEEERARPREEPKTASPTFYKSNSEPNTKSKCKYGSLTICLSDMIAAAFRLKRFENSLTDTILDKLLEDKEPAAAPLVLKEEMHALLLQVKADNINPQHIFGKKLAIPYLVQDLINFIAKKDEVLARTAMPPVVALVQALPCPSLEEQQKCKNQFAAMQEKFGFKKTG